MQSPSRIERQDYIGVYNCETWELEHHFRVDTYDLVRVCWSPDSRLAVDSVSDTCSAIAVQDSHLEYNVQFYSPDGRLLGDYQAYTGALGIKSMAWSKTGRILAVGSYDQKIRLVNHLTWKPIIDFDHQQPDVSQVVR